MALINLSPFIDDSFGLTFPSVFGRRQKQPRRSNCFDLFDTNTPSFFNVDRLIDPSCQHDITSDDKELKVSIDVPGVKLEDLKVKVHDGVIEVSGARQRGESKRARFSRSFSFDPDEVDVNKLQANLSDGVLVLRLPKKKLVKADPVEVKITNEPHNTAENVKPKELKTQVDVTVENEKNEGIAKDGGEGNES